MPFVRVQPDNLEQVATEARIANAARVVDDPEAFPVLADMLVGELRYGWDSEPSEHYLYVPEGSAIPVGTVEIDMPTLEHFPLAASRAVLDDPAQWSRTHS